MQLNPMHNLTGRTTLKSYNHSCRPNIYKKEKMGVWACQIGPNIIRNDRLAEL